MMGIGQTVKNMIGSGNLTANPTVGPDSNHSFTVGQAGKQETGGISNFRSQYDSSIQSVFGSSRQADYERSSKLDSDTANGMFGHGESTILSSNVRGKEHDSGSTELGGIRKSGTTEEGYGSRGSIGTGVAVATTGIQHQRRTSDVGGTGFGDGTGTKPTLPADDITGHSAEHTTKPTNDVIDESHQLHPITTHENVTQCEIEEVLHEKEHDQHVHHAQDHAQHVTDKNLKDEVHPNRMHPVTNIHETHFNKLEEINMLHGQIQQHKDFREEGERERTVIDKGESINEREIHHLHHVVQPIINKETIEQHRIHTMIPVHQVTHEAPIIHKSQTHAPVTLEHFTQKGGLITGGLTYDQIGSTILRSGECTREVAGEGENIAWQLTGSGLPGYEGHFGRHSAEDAFGKERLQERDQGGLRSGTQAPNLGAGIHSEISGPSNKTIITSCGETTSMYGFQGRVMDPYGGSSRTGLKDIDPMTFNMGAGTSEIGAARSSSTSRGNRSGNFTQHEGRQNG